MQKKKKGKIVVRGESRKGREEFSFKYLWKKTA